MDLSHNSGLIKFLNVNRDSYEERISCMPSKCQLRKSNCSFPAATTTAVDRPISLATSSYACDIFGIRPLAIDTPRCFPFVSSKIPSDSATFYLPAYLDRRQDRANSCSHAVKLARPPPRPRHPRRLKVGSFKVETEMSGLRSSSDTIVQRSVCLLASLSLSLSGLFLFTWSSMFCNKCMVLPIGELRVLICRI